MNSNEKCFLLTMNRALWGCRLVWVIVLLITSRLPADAAQSETDWLSYKDGKATFRIPISVLNSDGTTATGYSICARTSQAELEVANQGGISWLDLCPANLTDFHSLRIVATSQDGAMMAHQFVFDYQVRQFAGDGVTLVLKPARSVNVSVFHQNNPVPNASVEIRSYGVNRVIETDDAGMANFKLPVDAELISLLAWNDETLIGGIDARRDSGNERMSNELKVELYRCKPLRIRVSDLDGVPLKQFRLKARFSTPGDGPEEIDIPYKDFGAIVTDANGEAIFKWWPIVEGDRRVSVARGIKGWRREVHRFDDDGLLVQFKSIDRQARKKIVGKLDLPPGERGGFLLTLSTFQGERENQSDTVKCFVDDEGRYELAVLPGATCIAYINDVEWGSSIWDGIVVAIDGGEVRLPEIQWVRNVPVEVVATQGPSREPIVGLDLRLANRHRYSWEENGERHSGRGERRWSTMTNEDGIATTRSSPGHLRAYANGLDWRLEKKTMVRPGETVRLEFRRSTAGSQPISGTVDFANGDFASRDGGSLEQAKIIAYAADGESSGNVETTADTEGGFEFSLPGNEIAYLIMTADGKYSAAGTAITTKDFRPRLQPCVSFRGRAVNQDGKPMANCKVVIEANVVFESAQMGLRNSFSVQEFYSQTDEDGCFEFLNCLPTNIKLRASLSTAENKTYRLETMFLEPNEDRGERVFAINDTGRRKARTYTLSQIFDSRVIDARLANAHVLVVVHPNGERVERFIKFECFDDDVNRDINRYLTLQVNPGQNGSATDIEFMQDRDWSIPGENELVLLAIGPTGIELGKITLDVTQVGAGEQVTKFLIKHAPVQKDARLEFEEALAEAKRTDRKVWARVSQTRCAPCFLLSRWIDENREQLEKEFVLLKVDNVNEKNGLEIYKLIMPPKGMHGVPFSAIFDQDGNMLIDSRGPLGNIGFSRSYEGKKHLKKMLSTELKHLAPEEIQELVENLD